MAFSTGHFWEGSPALGWCSGRGERAGHSGLRVRAREWFLDLPHWALGNSENSSRWSGPVRWSQKPQPGALPIPSSQPVAAGGLDGDTARAEGCA